MKMHFLAMSVAATARSALGVFDTGNMRFNFKNAIKSTVVRVHFYGYTLTINLSLMLKRNTTASF